MPPPAPQMQVFKSELVNKVRGSTFPKESTPLLAAHVTNLTSEGGRLFPPQLEFASQDIKSVKMLMKPWHIPSAWKQGVSAEMSVEFPMDEHAAGKPGILVVPPLVPPVVPPVVPVLAQEVYCEAQVCV